MNHDWTSNRPAESGFGNAVRFDEGLRRHMLGIYRNMGLALLISAAVAWVVASTPAIYGLIFGTPLKWVAMLAPLAFVFFFSFRFEKMTLSGARMALFAFAGLMGLSLASVLLVFTGASIATTFLIAAVTFLTMSLWGYTTKADLTRYSTFLFMGLIGVVLASVVNLFLQSSALQIAVSIIGVLVFTGLTAWDTQRAKADYVAYGASQQAEKLAVMSALSLYLNFVNLFQLLLQFTGVQQEQ
ncbi:hypothetical protein FHS61_000207 [Altererythrobacter atlanticus]|uniref:Inner membrane protein YbhL n=1 Tax=Croceibacterium atlanticum TaxID=1267766 RepID=A0A0F7KT90_9SPHN|nr:Bax inhibitor-1/YccA family protein [Croceibacterium atlanticum]AKH42437.1 Inner membrane protein YbhL [Croceibacterium atlanticum]MBB5731214.1 hypothetical protein [Croceibacterium atlanticum]